MRYRLRVPGPDFVIRAFSDSSDSQDSDGEAVWRILRPVFSAGETYAVPRDIDAQSALRKWTEDASAYVAEIGGVVVGTYYIRANYPGPGRHVCNCGYAVSEAARGQGVATAMCRHSLTVAKALGFFAMQYNLVASTNVGAVGLWKKMGFDIVGTLPGAFEHPADGFVDAYVMYRTL